MAQGFVYILVSPNSNYIKIGGTEKPISVRLRAINGTMPYADHGPWELSDFLHVTDWQLVERGLHKHFQKVHIKDVMGTRELFDVPPHEARKQLRLTDGTLRIEHDKTQQIFHNRDLSLFLFKLFQLSGLFGNLDIQGAWTLNILPPTWGGLWFTLNIGSHAVAFTPRKLANGKFSHHLSLDRLIVDYPETVIWIGRHNGEVHESPYRGAKRAVQINFDADFADAEKLFRLPGIRRALVAYWSESLADLRERSAKSSYAKHHSYDAVAELLEYKRATESVFHPLERSES
jgi:hypothetical protein